MGIVRLINEESKKKVLKNELKVNKVQHAALNSTSTKWLQMIHKKVKKKYTSSSKMEAISGIE